MISERGVFMMKKWIAGTIGIAILLVATVGVYSTFSNSSQAVSEYRGYIQHLVSVRLDKQNDVYYHLGGLIEDLVDGKVTAEQIEAFCSGVTIFTRDELTDGACDIVCGDERELQSTLRNLLYAGSDISAEQLQQLSDSELDLLAELCFDLCDCCDRGKADRTLAHFISAQEFGSDEYLEELQATNDLLARFADMLPTR